MKTRVRALSLAVAAASIPVLGLVTAEPAAAANCSYPATSSPYELRIAPKTTRVITRGTTVEISTRLVKGSLLCSGRNIYLYARDKGRTSFKIVRTGTTDGQGRIAWNVRPGVDVRFYTRLEGTQLASPLGLIQVQQP